MNEYSEIATNEVFQEKNLEILNDFRSISLNEMDEVKLLNRYDLKYWFDIKCLPKILEAIKDDYYVLDLEGTKIQTYNTIYFDTPDDHFYVSHHNGKSTRLKIRKRKYITSGVTFLEIKKKNNKEKTSKKRMSIKTFDTGISEKENNFIDKNTSLNLKKLEAKYSNLFNRITLVSKNFDERCTIDTDLKFHSNGSGTRNINNLAIIELKLSNRNMKSKIAKILKKNKIFPDGFSKYCMGRALNESSLKRNRFKPSILRIEKQFAIQ